MKPLLLPVAPDRRIYERDDDGEWWELAVIRGQAVRQLLRAAVAWKLRAHDRDCTRVVLEVRAVAGAHRAGHPLVLEPPRRP